MTKVAKDTANKGGRPPKFADPAELEGKVKAYFVTCEALEKPLTIHGLCVALGTTRETLSEYATKAGFTDTIKAAKEKIRCYVEEQLFTGKNQAAMIFWMKNNAGWKDEQHQRVTVDFSKLTDEELETIAAGQSEA